MKLKGGECLMTHWNPYQPVEDGLPPKEMRLLELRAEPWPNQSRRIRIHLEITPFLERPSLQVTISTPQGREVSSIHIIETIESQMTFTMHLKGEVEEGPLRLYARLFYQDTEIVDEKTEMLDWSESEAGSAPA
jgi:hypothetical protein